MGSEQEDGKVRAEKTFEKMCDPEMEEITHEFIVALNIRPPAQFREIFSKSTDLHNRRVGIFKDIESRPRYNKPDVLFEMMNGKVQEKFSMIYYHLQNAIALQRIADGHIGRIILKANELGIDWPITLSIGLGKIYYEYEAFILQCRACMDHFAHSLSYYFGFFGNDLFRVKRKLIEISSKNDKAKRIVRKMEENKEFYSRLQELLISMSKKTDFMSNWSDRDKIAHYGTVLMRPMNIMINPELGTKVLHLARQEKGKDTFDLPKITEVMELFMWDLLKFVREIYSIMLED